MTRSKISFVTAVLLFMLITMLSACGSSSSSGSSSGKTAQAKLNFERVERGGL